MIVTAEWCDGFIAGLNFAVVWTTACCVVYLAAVKERGGHTP